MHSDVILNNSELQGEKMKNYEIGQPPPGKMKTPVIVAFWRYSKRYFGTAVKILKATNTMVLSDAII